MLHREITTKGELHIAAGLLVDDLRQELEVFKSYTVTKEESDEDVYVKVFSDQSCNILTSSCIETVLGVIGVYTKMYYNTSYHFGTLELGKGNDWRILPCITICLNVKK